MRWFGIRRKQNRQAAGTGDHLAWSRFRLFGGRRYLNNESYFLPKDGTEINRLDFQHYLLRYMLRGNYAAPIGQPRSILDVGSGTGRWGHEMAQQFPRANVVGLDLVAPPSDTSNPDLRPQNYSFIQGNVLDGLPFADGTFDFVHQRLLVAGIPLARWPGVVGELLRVTRPGGWVELVEAIPATGGPAMNQLREWLVGSGLPRGVDIRTTHQIGQYLQSAGAQHVVYRELNVPLGHIGGRVGQMMETNYYSLHVAIRGLIIERGIATPEMFDATMARARQEIATGQYVWPYFLAYGQRPQ